MMRRRKTIVGQLAKIKAKQRGFTLPLSIGVGISMLLLGSLMIARSNVDQGTAIAQVQTAGALSVAEAGVARTLSQLNSPANSHLMTLNYERNHSDGGGYLGADQILRSGDESTPIDQWSTAGGGCASNLTTGDVGTGSNLGSYRVLAYRYNPTTQVGSLLVEGTFRGSTSRVQVSIDRRNRTIAGNTNFPGLYARSTISLGNNDVKKVTGQNGWSANVICAECVVPNGSCDAATGQPTDAAVRSAVNANTNNSQIDGKIILATLQLPPVPTAPAGTPNLGNITNSRTLPRSTDTPDANGVYHYNVDSIDLSGNNNIKITHPNGTSRVRLYVSGDIKLSGGNADFQHSNSSERFAIFGTNPTSQTFTFNGSSATTNVFIHAPNATVGIKGGGSKPGITGAIWARAWDGSNSNRAEIMVPDNMPALLEAAFGNSYSVTARNFSTAPTSWSREGAVRP
jgi:hypothetical protein